MYLLKMNLKKYRHFTHVFLLVKSTLIIMEDNFIQYFNQFTKLLKQYLVLKTQSQNGNLRDFLMKNLNLLIEQIKFFLQNCYGIILD